MNDQRKDRRGPVGEGGEGAADAGAGGGPGWTALQAQPEGGASETKVVLLSTVSLNATFCASCGPWFVTVIV